MDIETFKQIKGYEGNYEISNYGNVKSTINRYINKGDFIMSPDVSNKGYSRVQLSKPRAKVLVHRLVAQHFLKNIDNLPVVNHLDNNPQNNNVTNLEWTTTSGNMLHAQKQGRLTDAQEKGRKASAEKMKEQALEKANAMIGHTFNSWTVLSVIGFKETAKNRNLHINCRCTCGNLQSNPYGLVRDGTTKQCITCRATSYKEKRYQEIQKELVNKIKGNWKFTGNTNYYIANSPTSKKLKVEAVCLNCGAKCVHPYPTLISNTKPLKKCPNCLTR